MEDMDLRPTLPAAARVSEVGERRRRGAAIRTGLGLAVLAAVIIAALVVVFLDSATGQRVERIVMEAMYTDPRTDRVLLRGLDLVSEAAVALAIIGVSVIGGLRHRLALGFAGAAVIGAANITTQVLKYVVIERPDLGDVGDASDNTLPSGHVTVISSILVGLLVVLPARWRPVLVPVVTFLATCAGIGTIVLNWHRPSDVMAAYAVVLGVAGLVVASAAAAGRLRERVPGGAGRLAGYAAWAALAVCAVGALILMAGVAPAAGRRDVLLAVVAMAATSGVGAFAIAATSYAVDLLGDGEPVGRSPVAPLG